MSSFSVTPFPPNTCGVGGPPPTEKFKAKISSKGKFKGTLFEVLDDGSLNKSEAVTGKFKSGDREVGTMKPLGVPADCVDTFKYSTQTG